ncbi:MAG: transposase [Bacteroidota bacterium]
MGRRMRTYFSEQPVRFITTTFKDWKTILINEDYFNIVCESLNFVCIKYVVDLTSYVLMPNHIHLVGVFSKPSKVSDFMRDFKKFTSGELRRKLFKDNNMELLKQLKIGNNKYKIWKDRFDDYALRDVRSVHTKINYIHQNPVRKGLVERPEDYIYSSAGFYLNQIEGKIKVTHFIDALGPGSTYGYGQIK